MKLFTKISILVILFGLLTGCKTEEQKSKEKACCVNEGGTYSSDTGICTDKNGIEINPTCNY